MNKHLDFFEEPCIDCGKRDGLGYKRCSCGKEREITTEIKTLIRDYKIVQRQIGYHEEAVNKAAKEEPQISPKKKEERYLEYIKARLEEQLPYLNRFVYFQFTPNGKQGADITIQVIIDSVLYKQTLTEVKEVGNPRWMTWIQKLKDDGAKDDYDWLCLLSKVRYSGMGNRGSIAKYGCVIVQSMDIYVAMMSQWCDDTIKEYFDNPGRKQNQEYKLVQLALAPENINHVRGQIKTYCDNIMDGVNQKTALDKSIERNAKALVSLLTYNELINSIINETILPTTLNIPSKITRFLPMHTS